MLLPRLPEQQIGVQMRDIPVFTSMSEMMKFLTSYGNGDAQRNWPLMRSSAQMPPPSPTITAYVALLAAADVGVDPLHELRIRVDRRSSSVRSCV